LTYSPWKRNKSIVVRELHHWSELCQYNDLENFKTFEGCLPFLPQNNPLLRTKLLSIIDHFTVACLVAWPLNESEVAVNVVLN